MDKFKCVECEQNEVDHEDDLCDDCFYDVEEDLDFDEDEE
jgi:NMD protein affecting ribosome stability and mRNA decay